MFGASEFGQKLPKCQVFEDSAYVVVFRLGTMFSSYMDLVPSSCCLIFVVHSLAITSAALVFHSLILVTQRLKGWVNRWYRIKWEKDLAKYHAI